MSPEKRERRLAALKAWRAKNPDRVRKYNREGYASRKAVDPTFYRADNAKRWAALPYEKRLLKAARDRALTKGREFTLTAADIVVPERCPVLGMPLRPSRRGLSPNSPSIDRIDSSKGYTPDNIQIVSWRANSLKKDATFEEIEALYFHMKSLRDRDVGFDETGNRT